MSPRSFVFSVWVANNKDALKTVAALETIAANNFTVAKEGGRVLVLEPFVPRSWPGGCRDAYQDASLHSGVLCSAAASTAGVS